MRRGADRDPAAGRLPDGERFYALALRFHTSTSLSPEEAHQIGLRQVEEISAEADPLLRREGLTRGSVGARLTEPAASNAGSTRNTDAAASS